MLPHILVAAAQIAKRINHALPRAVIGITAAAPGLEYRETRGIDQLALLGAGARRVKRRMFQKPKQIGRFAGLDRRDAFFHCIQSFGIRHLACRHTPLGGIAMGSG
jgi:hypothetical protein